MLIRQHFIQPLLIKGDFYEKKPDRRVLRTRKRLLDGLTDLLKEKDIKDISVKELADHADINRCTFYLHYKDVYDMLEKIEMELVDDFNSMLDSCIESTPTTDPYPFLYAFFTYANEHRETLSVLLGQHGDLAFINYMKKIVQDRMHFIWEKNEYRTDNFEYYSSFIISGCLGLLEKWIQNGFVGSPEDMAEFASKMVLQGVHVFS